MINKLGQVMLYVKDQDKAEVFWKDKVGFKAIAYGGSEEMGMKWIEIAPTEDAETTIVLHDKEVISKMSPDLNLGTPSLMFYSDHIEKLHAEFKKKILKRVNW
ncbi:Glyoxalase/bleomycin resistance protein/dioxygenase [Planococcus donghaensis MPA1U2]|uniref:Glyoxalase/bleomycin resistance protein/dioxygenase n=1 Tax=Planococcus donghaensis MPA1U2 TaxID=933115 RepID=E7RDG3_9BACL|nr:Glyoxalase/bleomycin resistance protein/dioxygenase [Planococcus donghaensis MPA1U2]